MTPDTPHSTDSDDYPAEMVAKRHPWRLFVTCLAVIVVSAFLASRIQNSAGEVRVTSIILPTENGQWVAADLFRPLSATKENPAPLVVVVPGFQRSKETHANVAIELARRGIVVINIDPYAQGSSSSSLDRRSATNEGYGMFSVIEYIANTDVLNYVDKSRIGATGHSAGGNAALRAAAYFGRQARQSNTASKLHAAYVSGFVLTMTERTLRHVDSNLGMSYAFYDEGAYRNELKNGDMRRAPEALRFVNSGIKAGAPLEELEMGRFYGDTKLRTLRVVHNEDLLHPFQPYSAEETAHQIEFFQKVFGLEDTLQPRDQTWYWKEVLLLMALAAALISLVPMAQLYLAFVEYFHPLVHPVPTPAPRPVGRSKVVFWLLLIAGAVIACFSYIPMTELSQMLFVESSNRMATWFFPQRMNNGVMLWALFNGIVGFGLFFLGRWLNGHKAGLSLFAGAATSLNELWRSFLLAAVLFWSFYLILFVVYTLFHVDYRFLFLGVRLFQPELLLLVPMYAPAFFLFFLSNSLRVNAAIAYEGQPEWRTMLLAGFANSLGLLFILGLQYFIFLTTGTVHWTEGWLYINLLFGVVPMMFILPYFHRYFYLMTGRMYLGPMITCLVFVMILLSNTVCYFPL
jgi:acetyl esterase/lipase